MGTFQVESLENRTLLSADGGCTADLSASAQAAVATRAALTASPMLVASSVTTRAAAASPITLVFPATAPQNWRGRQAVTKLSAWVKLQNTGTVTIPAGVHTRLVLSTTDSTTNPTPIAGTTPIDFDTTKAIKPGKKLKVTYTVNTPFTFPTTGPVYVVETASFTDPATGSPASAAGTQTVNLLPAKPYPVTTPSMIHDYVGTLTTKAEKVFGVTVAPAKTHRFEVNVTGQTLTTLVGYIQIDGTQEAGTMTGAEMSNGKFHFDLSTKDYDISFSGQLDAAGTTMTGSGDANLSGLSLFKLKGDFTATAI